MRKRTIKKVVLWSTFVFLFLVAVLAVHIYVVTRPKAPDANTIVLARIDFKQPITHDDAALVTKWLYEQNGVDHATCNPGNRNAVFTFHPVKMTGEQIMKNFRSAFTYNAERYIPSADEMKGGCPVASTSAVYKIYNYIKSKF